MIDGVFRLRLSEKVLEVAVDALVEAPRLLLVGIDGEPIEPSEAFPVELQRERSPDGLWRYRGIPDGALMRLVGTGTDGSPRERSFELGAAGGETTT